MQANPGVYAMLLGSGVSRTAEVPTGWDIIVALIRKIAAVSSSDPGSDPVGWYVEEFGHQPSYAALLAQLAPTPAERTALLRAYFEATEEERAEGKKAPTRAHRAIARLVAGGYVRVVLSTNFDRLLEQALEEVGITPFVIRAPEDAAGAPPLAHLERPLLVKLHGDYLDTRLRNTPDELASYDVAIDGLLDRILDEFGLIVCGWSAEWDQALRAAMLRSPSRRYSTYWISRGVPSSVATDLIEKRGASMVSATGADEFFEELAEAVTSVEELARPHPLSSELAVAALKRYLPDPGARVRLHDLISAEVERAYPIIDAASDAPSFSVILARLKRYELATERLQHLFAVGSYWGSPAAERVWVEAIERLANHPATRPPGADPWMHLNRYPATLLLYAGGIACVASRQLGSLTALVKQPSLRTVPQTEEQYASWELAPPVVYGGQLEDGRRRFTPLSDRIFEVVRPALASLIRDDDRFQVCFDQFEYLLATVYAGTRDGQRREYTWPGRFAWSERLAQTEAEVIAMTNAIVDAGLFGARQEFMTAVGITGKSARQLHWN